MKTMKTIDRIILGSIAVGLWTSIFMFNTHPRDAYALSIDASDIDGLRYFITNVVENCKVRGEVYIYDRDGGYGEIEYARIRC